MKNIGYYAFVIFIIYIVSGFAKVQYVEPCLTGIKYNFIGGIWHGIIAIPAFIFSLFNKDIAVYAVNNTGSWYTFGFLLGLGSCGVTIKITQSKIKNKFNI